MSFLTVDSGFWELAFPGQLLLGLGLGFTFVPLSNLALVGAGAHDAGAASAMLNATQQVGASIGTALLATLSVGAITNYITDAAALRRRPAATRPSGLQAQVEGYTTAFTWAAVLLVLGAARVRGADQGDQGGPARRGRRPRGVAVVLIRPAGSAAGPAHGSTASAGRPVVAVSSGQPGRCCSAIARRRAL